MAQDNPIPEVEWIRNRIGRLWALRWSVTDALAVRAIDDLIAEAEQRVKALEASEADKA